LAAQKEKDKPAGRPESDKKRDLLPVVLQMKADGKSLRKIAEALSISKSTVENWVKLPDSMTQQTVQLSNNSFLDTGRLTPDGIGDVKSPSR